jgi:hypothetical protein
MGSSFLLGRGASDDKNDLTHATEGSPAERGPDTIISLGIVEAGRG